MQNSGIRLTVAGYIVQRELRKTIRALSMNSWTGVVCLFSRTGDTLLLSQPQIQECWNFRLRSPTQRIIIQLRFRNIPSPLSKWIQPAPHLFESQQSLCRVPTRCTRWARDDGRLDWGRSPRLGVQRSALMGLRKVEEGVIPWSDVTSLRRALVVG